MSGKIYLLLGLGFGDEGKGSVTDYLVRRERASLVVRYNGGPQAAHNVVTDDSRHHTFSQFGSGTLAGAATHLSWHMMVDPLALEAEAAHLVELGVEDPLDSLTVDGDALLVTQYHRAVNRMRELQRGDKRHGSCGVGVGEARAWALEYPSAAPRVRDLLAPGVLMEKLAYFRDAKLAELGEQESIRATASVWELISQLPRDVVMRYPRVAANLCIRSDAEVLGAIGDRAVVFEGAQGALLDQDWGFHPHTTWSNTTLDNAYILTRHIDKSRWDDVRRIGVIRSYMTRHGAGPLPTEESGFDLSMDHNKAHPWQGQLRVGCLDLVLLRYAREFVGELDEVAVTHCDRIDDGATVCSSYDVDAADGHFFDEAACIEMLGGLEHQERLGCALSRVRPRREVVGRDRLLRAVSDAVGAPITITSSGPRSGDKRDL